MFLRGKRFLRASCCWQLSWAIFGLNRSPTGPPGYHAHNGYNMLGCRSEENNLYSLYIVYTNLTKAFHTSGGVPDWEAYQHTGKQWGMVKREVYQFNTNSPQKTYWGGSHYFQDVCFFPKSQWRGERKLTNNSSHLCIIYYAPGISLMAFCMLYHLIPHNPLRYVLLLSSFYRCWNQGMVGSTSLPKFTQRVSQDSNISGLVPKPLTTAPHCLSLLIQRPFWVAEKEGNQRLTWSSRERLWPDIHRAEKENEVQRVTSQSWCWGLLATGWE